MTTERVDTSVPIDYQTMAILLPTYDGNKKTLHFYIKCVENVMDMLENKEEGSIACLILNKLTGKAIEVLSERTTFKTWSDIKSILMRRFGEVRGEVELTQELIKLNRNKDNLEIFSDKIRELTYSLINCGSQKSDYYEKMAISVLLDQVHPMISIMVRTQNPSNLEEVISLVKLEELKYNKYRAKERENVKHNPTPFSHPVKPAFAQHKPYNPQNNSNIKKPMLPFKPKYEKVNHIMTEVESEPDVNEYETEENFPENLEENPGT